MPYNAAFGHAFTSLRELRRQKLTTEIEITEAYDLSKYITFGKVRESILFFTNENIYHVDQQEKLNFIIELSKIKGVGHHFS